MQVSPDGVPKNEEVPVGLPHGNGDIQLLAALDDVLARVWHNAEQARELLHRETHGPMPVIWEALFMDAGWGGRQDLVLGEVAAMLVPKKVGLGNPLELMHRYVWDDNSEDEDVFGRLASG